MLAFFICVGSLAHAATLVALPPGEAAAAWAQAFALAGLTVSPPGSNPAVVITAEGDSWRVTVRDEGGTSHQVRIPPPLTPQSREDAAWLIGSLVRPERYQGSTASTALPRPVLPPAPPPAPPAKPPAARTASPPPAAPVVALAAPAPVVQDQPNPWGTSPVAETASASPPPPAPTEALAIAPLVEPAPAAATALPTAPEAVSAPPPGPSNAFASVDSRLAWRSSTLAAMELGVVGGAAIGPWQLGARFALTSGARLTALDGDRTMDGLSLGAVGGWAPQTRVAPMVEVSTMLDLRRYLEDGVFIGETTVPEIGCSLGVRIAVGEHFVFSPHVDASADLRPTDLVTPEGGTTTLSPWSLGAGLSVRFGVLKTRSTAIQSADARHPGEE